MSLFLENEYEITKLVNSYHCYKLLENSLSSLCSLDYHNVVFLYNFII